MVPYPQSRPYQQHLYALSIIDDDDVFGEKLEKNFALVSKLQTDVSEKEGRERIAQHACRSTDDFVEIMDGLLYAILSEPGSVDKLHGDMTTVSLLNPEAFNPVTKSLTTIATEKFPKLCELSKKQFLWLLKTFTKNGIAGLERVYNPLMRNITAGDTWKNVSLIESLIEIFSENKPFLDNPSHTAIIHMAVLTFLELIQLHQTSLSFSVIKDKEIDFCLYLLRTKFAECSQVGKELVRLLMAVCKMPKVRDFWDELVNNPKSLCLSSQGIPQLLQTRTARWLYSHRVSVELEEKITFLLSKVRAVHQNRYINIFIKLYIPTSLECDVMLPEIIRFVCRIIHPTNEILGSDVLQRWNFILILISSCKTQAGLNNCLLALFYDWILFDQSAPDHSIMNIEPGMLLMMNAWHRNVKVLQKPLVMLLVDYLCKVPFEFFPPVKEKTRLAVVASFKHILDKGVVRLLDPVYEAVPEDLKCALRKSFPEIFDSTGVYAAAAAVSTQKSSITNGSIADTSTTSDGVKDEIDNEDFPLEPVILIRELPQNANTETVQIQKNGIPKSPLLPPVSTPALKLVKPKAVKEAEFAELLEQLPESLRYLISAMKNGTAPEKSEAMEEFVMIVINQGQHFDVEDCDGLAKSLAIAMNPIYDNFRLPDDLTEEAIEDSVQSPLFILFRRLWEEDDSIRRERVLALLAEMDPYIPKMGFLLIYYIMFKAPIQTNAEDREPMADFEDFCAAVLRRFRDEELDQNSYRNFISDSLERCGQLDHNLLVYIVPFVYLECPKVTKDVPSTCQAVVSFIDAKDVKSLCCLILQKKLIMFTERGCGDVIKESLKWESIEQTYFWKLFNAHDLKGEYWPKELLTEITDFREHPEATMQLLETVRDSPPREEHVRELFKRDPDPNEPTLVTLCLNWTRHAQTKSPNVPTLAEIIGKLLIKAAPSQKKRAGVKTPPPKSELTVDQILGHLEVIRDYMTEAERSGNKRANVSGLVQMLYDDHIQVALRNVKSAVPSVRDRFREVFALVMDDPADEHDKPSKKTAKRARSGNKTGSRSTASRESDSDRSDEEETVAPSTKSKKVRKTSPSLED